jgi:hypothetical protein
MRQCSTCHGTYSPVQADGTLYFHACPPVVDKVTGVATPMPNARNENVPTLATLQPQIAAVPKSADQTYWTAVNTILATAIVAPGAGSTVVAAGQVAPVVGL